MAKHRWIRDDIEINFPLPTFAKELIKKLEELDEAENYAYENYAGALDVRIKELVRQGKMTQRQWDLLCEKYVEVM